MLDGEQYIVVATGNGAASASASLVSCYSSTPESRTPPRLLGLQARRNGLLSGPAKIEPVPEPPSPRQNTTLLRGGEVLFSAYQCEYRRD